MLLRNVAARRPGMILLVVVAFLALFTIMGITYLLYADSKLRNSIDEIKRLDKRDYRALTELDTTFLLNFFLERFIYDQPDSEPDIYATATGGINYEPRSVFSSLRGHSLARNMYGFNSTTPLNDRPFSGTGKLSRSITIPGTSVTIPENQLLNHTYFKSFGQTQIIDPERGPRNNLTTLAPYSSSWNAPYTYPDFNNLYLAMLRPDGKMGKPSFHLESVFGKMDLASRTSSLNPNWLNERGRYMSIRPRPVDNLVPADYAAAGGDPVKLAAIVNQRHLEKSLFPYPDDGGFDVKNLDGYPDNINSKNDSIWIDVGSPVFYNIDGRKYKILVAPLVLDLDGRVNLNYAGNNLAGGNHGSNQGWGTWEINPQKLNPALPLMSGSRPSGISATAFPTSLTSPVDFNGYFESATGLLGGPLFPGQGAVQRFASFLNFPGRSYGNLAAAELNNHPSTIPVVDSVSPFRNFWDRTGASYTTANHQELRNLLRWRGRDSDPMAANSAIVTAASGAFGGSDLTDPNSPTHTPYWNLRTSVTSLSAGFSRPAFVPYFTDGTANPIQLPMGAFYPKPPNPDRYTAPPSVGANSDFNPNRITSEAATWMGVNLNRNLTPYPAADLGAYNGTPAADGPGRIPTAQIPTVSTCNSERQEFANEIFQALLKITGVRDMSQPTVAAPVSPAYDPDFEANRYLAQLAVNLVDYLDNDNVSTNFVWKYDPSFALLPGNITPSSADPAYWRDSTLRNAPGIIDHRVYGVELNKVLINEVYAEIQNDPMDPFTEMPAMSGMRPAGRPFHVNFWLELVNPLPDISPGFTEYLEQNPISAANDSPVYQIRVFDKAATDASLKLFDPGNSSGNPDIGVAPNCSVSNFSLDSSTPLPLGVTTLDAYEKSSLSKTILPLGNNYAGNELSNRGFMVLGPPASFPGSGVIGYAGATDLGKLANIRTSSLRYTIPNTTNGFESAGISATISAKKHCVVLQRLANPYLAPQTNPLAPSFNPYITVDVFDDVKLNDGVTNDKEKMRTPAAVQARASTMRRQPYQDSRKTQTNTLMVEGGGPYTTMPQHTFLRHNGQQNSLNPIDPDSLLEFNAPPSLSGFTPILHLDRPIINPLELLNVAGCKPAELTRRFMNENSPGRAGSPFNTSQSTPLFYGHKIPWSDDANRLSRFLELANPVNRIAGSRAGAREYGKININSVWSREVFNALADVNATNNMNGFVQSEVDTVYDQMLASRSPAGGGDQPFWGLGVGGSQGGDDLTQGARGLENTVLRRNAFELPATDTAGINRTQYQRQELLSKIFNNITTKSNVFAVWLTVGYFEVTDDTTQPPKLGYEMGLVNGTSIRPKMFAIIDRTRMISAHIPVGIVARPTITRGVDQDLEPGAGPRFLMYDVRNNAPLAMVDGMSVTFEPDTPREETVVIRKFNKPMDPRNGHFVGNFSYDHTGSYEIIIRGNPGPWPNFTIVGSSPNLISASEVYAPR